MSIGLVAGGTMAATKLDVVEVNATVTIADRSFDGNTFYGADSFEDGYGSISPHPLLLFDYQVERIEYGLDLEEFFININDLGSELTQDFIDEIEFEGTSGTFTGAGATFEQTSGTSTWIWSVPSGDQDWVFNAGSTREVPIKASL